MSNINLYNFTRRVPCGVSLSTFELIPAVATAQPGAMVTVLAIRYSQGPLIDFDAKYVKTRGSAQGCAFSLRVHKI